jgi:hypothetical protein
MPTVKYKCPDSGKPMSKTFPYNAMNGSMKMNPGYGMEKKTNSSGY